MIFRQLFDTVSSNYTYLLASDGKAVLIDPVLDQVDRDLTILRELGLQLVATLDTHVHADHVTGATALKHRTNCEIVLSSKASAKGADRYMDHLEIFELGDIQIEARHTPGHTAGSQTFVVHSEKTVFSGDTLLIRGCGRTDFQQGDPKAMYKSVHEQIFSLPKDFLVYPGHDYKGRTVTTITEELQHNPRLGKNRSEAEFVDIMNNLNLNYPKMIDEALPANLELGVLHLGSWGELQRASNGALQASVTWVKRHGGKIRLVDIRTPPEWTSELKAMDHIQRLELTHLQAGSADWDRGEKIVLICRSGGRSDSGALLLESLGFRHVASMTGGMRGWHSQA